MTLTQAKNIIIKQTLKGLILTAKEKICVAGEEAREEVEKIKAIYDDLVEFWEIEEKDKWEDEIVIL
jgi:hypothetical protein